MRDMRVLRNLQRISGWMLQSVRAPLEKEHLNISASTETKCLWQPRANRGGRQDSKS
ncbi:hypothetical protein CUJ84_pRLN2000174 (plasmid) [Rhizobium leguminosarum]|uniref:Uncharacterized protein n=1 Tax=Rhizobium leguminosarum TaxID=384 RepID=A0A2K9ZEQ6_RHILE|nr:hypothetical protein CUJ84_pRLN2000174 [Rhizobium leguminosarum]